MSKHTPAPWNIAPRIAPYIATSNDPKIREWMESTGKDQFDALSVGTAKGSVAIIPLDESNEANAKLIAAAPELLYCQTMGRQQNTPDFLDWMADRLINIYGESPNIDFVKNLREMAIAGRAAIEKATK